MTDNDIKKAIECKQDKLFAVIAGLNVLASDNDPDNAVKLREAASLQVSIDALSRTLAVREDARKYHAWK